MYVLGRREGQIDSTTLLLGGIITASFISAVIMFLMTSLTGSNLRGMAFWLMGNLSTSLQRSVYWVLGIGFLVAGGAIYTTASDLNLLLSGEKEAMHLGVDVPRVRLVVYIAASVLTGLAVSVSGAIGYVGLLVPHVMRQLFGSDHRILIPTAALGGAIAVVIADTIARTIVSPAELPVGAMTALVGAPLFIYLLRRRMRVTLVARPPASAAIRSPLEASRANNDVRLSVEQVSYAYSPNPSQAPLFTLEASQFSGARRRNCCDSGAERQRKIYFAEIDCRVAGAAFREGAAEWI